MLEAHWYSQQVSRLLLRQLLAYDGEYSGDEQLIKELIAVAHELYAAVKALGPVGS